MYSSGFRNHGGFKEIVFNFFRVPYQALSQGYDAVTTYVPDKCRMQYLLFLLSVLTMHL